MYILFSNMRGKNFVDPVFSGQSEVRLAEALGNGFVWIPSSTQLL